MSMQSDTTMNKQPIKRLEIPISKFNDVAIPHHIGMLNRHRTNIAKLQETGEWNRVFKEQVNASRLVKQLKHLLYEMDVLRGQVQDSDIPKFDKLTAFARASSMNAIEEYMELEFELPMTNVASPRDEDQTEEDALQEGDIQINAELEELEQQQACLHAWNSLQNDMQQLHQLFVDFNRVLHDQGEHVNRIEDNVEEAQINVTQGTKFLERAAQYKTAAYPLAGALLGSCIGGPVGLIAGLKLGGLTAIGCGLLGFTGGTILKKKTVKPSTPESKTLTTEVEDNDLQNLIPVSENSKDDKKQL